jgi:hypothetical protein
MRSRFGSLGSLKYGGMKREANAVPRADTTRPEEGVGAGRDSKDWEDAMTTRDGRAKNRVKASWSSGVARGTHLSGHPGG